MLTALDLLLIIITLLVVSFGLARRWSLWRMGQDEVRKGSILEVLKVILGHRRILRRTGAGIAHAMVFWGVTLPLLAVIAAQFRLHMPSGLTGFFSLLLDLIGGAMLLGVFFFLVKRLRSRETDGPKRTLFPLVVLLLITLSGFVAEGTRLAITGTGFSWESPLGVAFSFFLPASPLFMQMTIRFHFFAVLLFAAILPFTFIRHLASASVNVFYRRETAPAALRSALLDRDYPGASVVSDFSWKQLLDAEACLSCGRCEETCPAFISGKPLSPKKIMRKILDQMEECSKGVPEGAPLKVRDLDISDDEIWSCTTCMACVEHCPVCIEPLDKIVDMRRYRFMEKGALPSEAKPAMRNLEIYGDVYGKGIAHRADWAFNRGVPFISDEAEVLLWVGCAGAFHPRYQDTARAMVKILKAAGVRFGILGKEELCCGDPARRLGEEGLFLDLAENNIARLGKYGLKKILTLCPHCFNTLKNEYGPMAAPFNVVHATEFLAELIGMKKITLTYALPSKVALHDPCYLGRGNGLYEPLRVISRSVRGVELVELPRNRGRGFCCGGGGGSMWLHENLGKRINLLRAEEVVRSGVQVLGTACPYCLTMLEDGIKALEVEHPVRVMDLVEMVASSIR